MNPYYLGQDVRAAHAETIAILGLEVVSHGRPIDMASTRVASQLTTALREQASANGPFSIAPDGNKELIDEKIMRDCGDERLECMIGIGRALHADRLLYGHLDRSRGGGYQVSLKLLDVGSGRVTQSTSFLPAADTSGTALTTQGRRMYDQLISRDRPVVPDGVLVRATNEAFWRQTNYKRGQALDMSDKRDREKAKIWLDLYKQLQAKRDRATQLAQRMVNETVNPYVLVIEERNGSLRPQTFPQRGNLDVQYTWLVDQPEYYAYLAMFDFTQRKDRPLFDQFALTKREQTPIGGWYSFAP